MKEILETNYLKKKIKGEEDWPFLAGGVPDLGFDEFIGDLNIPVSELDTDRRSRVESEFIFGETREEIGFSNAGIARKNRLEEIITVFVQRIRHFSVSLLCQNREPFLNL